MWPKKLEKKARELEIEIVENKPLARALNQTVEIGQEIPEDLYQAVAEILAFIYQSETGISVIFKAGVASGR